MGSDYHPRFDKTDEEIAEIIRNSKPSSVFHSENSMPHETELCEKLKSLPKIKAGPGFDQKMSALFSLELEEEIRMKTISFQIKSPKIRLPDLITDLRKEFL